MNKPREWTLAYNSNYDNPPPVVIEGPHISPKEGEVKVVPRSAYDGLKADNERLKHELFVMGDYEHAYEIIASREAGITKERDELKVQNKGLRIGWDNECIQLDLVRQEFKNFHSILCERFDYCHDNTDWKRDQLSLIEHIAKSRDELKAALENLIQFSIQLCCDMNISSHYPSIENAEKLLAKHSKGLKGPS